MPVLLRSRSPWNPRDTPVLLMTARARRCRRCGRNAHITLYSPSTFYVDNIRAGLLAAFQPATGQEPEPSDGQCCIRCTIALRIPADRRGP